MKKCKWNPDRRTWAPTPICRFDCNLTRCAKQPKGSCTPYCAHALHLTMSRTRSAIGSTQRHPLIVAGILNSTIYASRRRAAPHSGIFGRCWVVEARLVSAAKIAFREYMIAATNTSYDAVSLLSGEIRQLRKLGFIQICYFDEPHESFMECAGQPLMVREARVSNWNLNWNFCLMQVL